MPTVDPAALRRSDLATSGHTPGPWQACNMVHAERGDQMTPEEIGQYVANSTRLGDPSRFLFVTTDGEGVPDICLVGNGPSGLANARLIAAGPELLAALKDLMLIREWSIRAGADKAPLPHDLIVKFAEMQIPAVDAAYAAIAKAESRS